MTAYALSNLNRHDRRREKVFGDGRPRPMTRGLKLRLLKLAKALMRPTEKGKHWGQVSAKAFAVFRVLLFDFHNAISGKCFPSYEAIAEKAHCDRSTVHRAIIALEEAGLLTWLHRIRRVHERVVNLFGQGAHGQRSRVLRTSNGYIFSRPPDVVESSESQNSTGTLDQGFSLSLATPVPASPAPESALDQALAKLGKAIRTGAARRDWQ